MNYYNFVCPKCSHDVAVRVLTNVISLEEFHGVHTNNKSSYTLDYGDLTENYDEAECDSYECEGCGFTIPVSTDEELAKWIIKTCKQNEEPVSEPDVFKEITDNIKKQFGR